MATAAAGAAVGWEKRLRRHGRIAAAMTAGAITDSWAREIAEWTDKLPAAKRDEADAILLDAAAQGLSLDDLRLLARTIDEAWEAGGRDNITVVIVDIESDDDSADETTMPREALGAHIFGGADDGGG
jgi:hypothetical protein